MKLKHIVIFLSIVTLSFGLSSYVKGYRLYIRYVKHIPRYGIKAPDLLKKLHVNSTQQLNQLIESGKIVDEVKKFNPAAAKGIQKALSKDKKSLEIFLDQIFEGKIPPGCEL